MFDRLKKWLEPPHYADPNEQRIALLLNALGLSTLPLILIVTLVGLFFSKLPFDSVIVRTLPLMAAPLLSLWALRHNRLRLASYIFVYPIWLLLTLFAFFGGGVRAPAFSNFVIIILIASFVLGVRAALTLTGLTLCSGTLMVIAAGQGWLPTPIFETPTLAYWISVATGLIIASLLFYLFINGLQQAVSQLNTANQRLLQVQEEQEKRIAERTRALQISADVSRQLSTILDQSDLINAIVRQVQRAFNYYHVHIYLFDKKQNSLALAGGTGEAGRAMLLGNHRIPAGKGLVGFAAQSRQPVLVPDVAADERWLPNPLLPDTRAEVAIPIIMGNEVSGVLDVQHNVRHGLSSSDVDLLQLIANQVAIALQNARSYEAVRRLATHEFHINTIGQKIQQANTIEEVLAVAAAELGQALNAQQAGVLLSVTPAAYGQSS
ncbi:MAG: hypothetical protein Fur0021_01950 [Candidatus Promineifilaceae bacterium]